MRRAAALLAAVALFGPDPARAQDMTSQQVYQMALKVRNDATALAERRCLSGQETVREQNRSFLASLTSLIKGIFVGVKTSDRQRVSRGAIDAPSSVYLQAQGATRECIERLVPGIEQALLVAARTGDPAGAGTGGYPGAIDVRFTYRRTTSLDPAAYSDNLRVALREPGRSPRDANVASQSGPDGSPYFFYTYVPFPSARVEGTISAKPLSSRYTADQIPRAKICFERAPLPARQPSGPDLFDCTEGGLCRPVQQSAGWLRQCPAISARKGRGLSDWLALLSPIGTAHAQPPATPAEKRWVTPSIDTLVANPGEPVGYSYFKVRSDAFRGTNFDRVEVAIAVNGVPVLEDGLAPSERPEPYDPAYSFDYFFALQTLNFEGSRGGCDKVTLALTPLRADGSRGTVRSFDLFYSALREQPERMETAGIAWLKWTATVIRPIREWRHWTIVHSYGFTFGDRASQKAAVAAVERDKAWLDSMRWTYEGAPIRGFIRPPLTIRDGRGNYGLAIGLVQPSGQVRFTFSESFARSLGQHMIARRAANATARTVIAPERYIYQAPVRSVTPDGICPPY